MYFIAAAVPIYLNLIIKNYNNRNNHLRYLSIVLAGFVTMQGMYHFAGALGFSLLAKAILEPLSFGILGVWEESFTLLIGRKVRRRLKNYNDIDSNR